MKKTVTSITIDERLKKMIMESKDFWSDSLSARIEEALIKVLNPSETHLIASNKQNVKNIQKGTKDSAGFDIKLLEQVVIKPGLNAIDLKTSFEIPKGHFGMLKLRSSIAKNGMFEYSGIIDSDYRGNCKLLVFNLMNDSFMFQEGDRIAQLVIIPYANLEVEYRETLTETERTGGFGSTGV